MFQNGINYQNGMGNFNPGMMNGTGYQYTGKPLVFKQWLTQDELQSIIQPNGDQFSLQITEDEKRRAICNHRTVDGTNDVIVPDGDDGSCKCLFCGYKFKPVDENMSKEEIQEAVDQVVDILQTVKMFYVNFPPEAAREYMQIIPLLEKLPKLFDYAMKDFAQHVEFDPMRYNNRGMNAYSMFSAIIGGGMPMPSTPMTQNQIFSNGLAPQQTMPGMNPAYAAPNSNGFGYNSPMMNPQFGMQQPQMGGYNPQTAGYQFNPQQFQQAQSQVAQPTQTQENAQTAPASVPTATAATTNGNTVDVQATFKP